MVYSHWAAGVSETTVYLEAFLRNLLLNEDNELKNRYLHIRWNDVKQDIGEIKQDIEPQKQDIEESKQDIIIPDGVGNKTRQHILSLFREYGFEKFFGRSEVMQILGITASPASALIKKSALL